jgi:hypothetical protein
MILFEEEYNGKPVFKVNFLDFCKLVCRDEKRTKFSLDNPQLMEHIVKTRYSKNYVVNYEGIMHFPNK